MKRYVPIKASEAICVVGGLTAHAIALILTSFAYYQVCMYVCMNVCMYAYMYVCMYTYPKRRNILFFLGLDHGFRGHSPSGIYG